jgi:hypothetical protein
MNHLSSEDLNAMMTRHQCERLVHSVVQMRMALKATHFIGPDLVRLLMAALMATFGLGSNNMAAIYGAFLVSPLMKPIIQVVFKVIHTAYMMKLWSGNRTEDQFGGTILDSFLTFFLAIFLNYVVGFVGGFILMMTRFDEVNAWPTAEMQGRTQTKNNVINFLIAVFC